jgi:hypothetical protein
MKTPTTAHVTNVQVSPVVVAFTRARRLTDLQTLQSNVHLHQHCLRGLFVFLANCSALLEGAFAFGDLTPSK